MAWQFVTSVQPVLSQNSNTSTPRPTEWVRRARWVQDGRFLTSSGVSAGTDAAVYAVKELLSPDLAAAAAKRLEYVPVVVADEDPFADEEYLPRVVV